MKIIRETETGSIVSFNYDNEIAEITGLTADINPIQDLHGYDKPWAGGNGKNFLNIGDIDATVNGITVKSVYDNDGNTIGVNVNGTATANTNITIYGKGRGDNFSAIAGKTLKLYGGANCSNNFYIQAASSNGLWGQDKTGNGSDAFTVESTEPSNWNAQVIVASGTTISNKVLYPMLCLASESADFVPYSNICPISGWDEVNIPRTGKNLFNNTNPASPVTSQGVTFTGNADGTISVSGTATGYAHMNLSDFPCKSSMGIITISGLQDATNIVIDAVRLYDYGGGLLATLGLGYSTLTVNLAEYPTVAKFNIEIKRQTNNVACSGTVKPQIELGSTATDYEPYNGNAYIIDLGDTRYSGTLDVTRGVFTGTKTIKLYDGSNDEGWSMSNGGSGSTAWHQFYIGSVASKSSMNSISNLFEPISISDRGTKPGLIQYQDRSFRIALCDKDLLIDSVTNWRTWLSNNNLQILYELAEPIEVQLAAEQIEALQGQNNVWANCGDITLSWIHAPVLSEAVKLNGKYLEMAIDGYTTLGTSGRRSLGREIDSYSVGTADGETVKNSRFPVRKITVNYVIQTDTEEELTEAINQLANILNQDECDFVFRDESDKFFSGYGLLDSEPKKYRHAVKGTWSLYCAYPFKRSTELVELSSKDPTVASVEAHSATFVFDYKGTLPARPILRAEFASAKSGGEYNEDGDCGYVAFLDAEENIIQLGNPEVLDVDQYANATLINREFDTLSDWTASGVTVGNITDQFWQNGKGQTQSYAKGTGSLTKSVTGAVDMEFDIVHRLCVSAANQTGKFECYAKNGNDIVVGFKIEKTGNGTAGTVSYILNNKVVGTDSIDLSYYNTHFGYCNRTARYVTQTYSVKETYYVKKKGKKKKKKTRWVTKTRQVQNGWNYTQSNLNSGWSKDGGVVVFSVGNLPDRTFKSSDIELTPSTSVVFGFTGSLHTNAVHSCAMLSKAGVPFAEIPNVFTSGDVVEGDCNSADVMLYRAGSLEGHLEPQYGALGNDWEDFEIKPGKNIIRAVWSDWVNTSYKPEIKIIFNEVYV